jgi:hypothetical protein
MAADLEARIWGVVGASGTGKGVWAKGKLRELAPARLVVWDFMDEYGDFAKPVRSLADLQKAMLKAGEGPLCVRYVARGSGEKALRREFEVVCELVYAWQHCVFVAEELANVTTPGWAPGAWRKMTTSGRHAGVHIIGMTQTPALVDKTFLGNCTLIHCCALREYAHRVAVARSMDVDDARIAALVRFQWIEKDFSTGQVTEGWVTPPGKNAPRHRRPTPTPTDGEESLQPDGPAPKVAPSVSTRQRKGNT